MRLPKPPSVLAASLTLLVTLGASACRRPVAEGDTPAETAPEVVLTVSAARVAVRPMRQEITLPGVTAALRTFTLRAPAAGRVEGLYVTTGDRVQRGQVIAHIINREEDAAQAGVDVARTIDPGEAAALERSVKRYSGGPGIAVRAPHNAVVIQRVVSPGQIVNEFDALVELVDPTSVYVDAQAPINQIGLLRAGMNARVVSSLKAGVVYPARVWSISPSFSPGGTTAPVWLEFTGPNRIAEIGAAVEVNVTTNSIPDAVVVPAEALFQDAAHNNFYVFKVGADGRAHRIVVATGIRTAQEVQVTNGLKPGELVITSGGYALSDGLRVRESVTPW
jgi:multidrug efflux pump subunit AcrA (membrane-fusion protein)